MIIEHCQIAHAALQLGDLTTISFEDYLTCSAKLDKAAVEYPEEFAVKAVLFVARHLLAAGTLSADEAIAMFRPYAVEGATPVPLHRFQAFHPGLQSISQLSDDAMERALVQGLFGIVLLHFMAPPALAYDAYAVAAALWSICYRAASIAAAASEAHLSVGRSVIARSCPIWLTDMQDAGLAVIVLYTGNHTNLGAIAEGLALESATGALHRVRQAGTGSLLLLASSFSNEPWARFWRALQEHSELAIMTQTVMSLRTHDQHIAGYEMVALRNPAWKRNLRTLRLKALGNLDEDDHVGCCTFMEHLRLVHCCLTAPSRPADAKLDTMQVYSPEPQLTQSSQAPKPASINRAMRSPLKPSGTCVGTPSSALLGRRRLQPPPRRGYWQS